MSDINKMPESNLSEDKYLKDNKLIVTRFDQQTMDKLYTIIHRLETTNGNCTVGEALCFLIHKEIRG